jgi:beta-glucosidase/6-phospho-beta-glucosidase/beta-galactosidase
MKFYTKLVCIDMRKQEDRDLMDYIGVNTYRFSISWARILPGKFFQSFQTDSLRS